MTYPSRSDLSDLRHFLMIARWGSFRKAATEAGLTTSALSHGMRKLEARLGVRLLNRTSRAVQVTPAGERLARRLEEGFGIIADALAELETTRSFPIGRLRVNVPRDAARLLLDPVTEGFAREYPGIELEISVDDRMIDVIGEGFDAGIRYGERVPRDMISVALTPPLRWVVVGAPGLIGRVGEPAEPPDLMSLPCLRIRLGDGSIFPWELGDGARMVALDVRGPLCLNDTDTRIEAALRGVGFGYVLEPLARREAGAGRLRIVLEDWASTGPPLCMYYPSRRQPPPGLRQLINMIRQAHGLPPLADGRDG